MKKIWLTASWVALSAACAVTACSSGDDDSNGTGGAGSGGQANAGSGGKNSGAGATSKAGTSGKGGSAAGEAGNTTGEAGKGSGEAGNAGAGGNAGGEGGKASGEGGAQTGTTAITACDTGMLFEGDPLFDGDSTAIGTSVDGQGLLDDPPLRNEALAFVGKNVFIETETEIWTADPSLSKPKLSRIAGQEAEGDAAFLEAGKACADTHFIVIRDMVAKANGKLAVVDYVGNAVVEISDPGGADCKSEYVAGTHVKSTDPGPDYPVLPGDQDGPGAQALFGNADNHGSLFRIATDGDNNLYVWDNGNAKFKMIANEDDADRTVTTVGVTSSDDNVMGLTYLKGRLYATGIDGTNDFLLEIDPAKYDAAHPTANVTEIFRERSHFDDVESGHQAVLSQLTNDGEALIVTGQSGFIWRLGTDGKVLATLAGTGIHLGYDGGFDPTKSHAASDWQLAYSVSNSNGGPWLAVNDSQLYWSGGYGVGEHIVDFSCK
jgi:hypothetical protein